MSCLLFWCCRGRQSDSDTETNANEEQLRTDGVKIKRKKKWRVRKRKGQQKKETTVDVERAEEIQAAQQPAAGEEGSDVPHLPAGTVSGRLGKISAGTPEKMGTPLNEEFQSTKDIPETSSHLTENLLDQIEAEAEAEAVIPLMSADLDEEADNNQPLEKTDQTMSTKAEVIEELMEALLQDVIAHSAALEREKLKIMAAEAEAEVIQELMNIYLDETEERVEKHLAGDEMFEALTKAEDEADEEPMLLFVNHMEAESLGCEVMSMADTEAEASTDRIPSQVDENDTSTDQRLAGDEMPELMATEGEAQVIKDLVLTDLQDRKTEDLVMNSADTEAEAIKPEQIHGDETDTANEQLLGCEVMSAADTEAEASTDSVKTHVESNDTTNDHLLDVEEKSDAEPDWMFDYEPIKSWADFMEETEGTIDQSEALKNDPPVTESKTDQQESSRTSGDRDIQVEAVDQWRPRQDLGKTRTPSEDSGTCERAPETGPHQQRRAQRKEARRETRHWTVNLLQKTLQDPPEETSALHMDCRRNGEQTFGLRRKQPENSRACERAPKTNRDQQW
ncbi:hypothetical protein MHYP_G00310050, partial [Metynnis hypsauchen]